MGRLCDWWCAHHDEWTMRCCVIEINGRTTWHLALTSNKGIRVEDGDDIFYYAKVPSGRLCPKPVICTILLWKLKISIKAKVACFRFSIWCICTLIVPFCLIKKTIPPYVIDTPPIRSKRFAFSWYLQKCFLVQTKNGIHYRHLFPDNLHLRLRVYTSRICRYFLDKCLASLIITD